MALGLVFATCGLEGGSAAGPLLVSGNRRIWEWGRRLLLTINCKHTVNMTVRTCAGRVTGDIARGSEEQLMERL